MRNAAPTLALALFVILGFSGTKKNGEYKIDIESDVQRLEQDVNTDMSNGWQPIGGMTQLTFNITGSAEKGYRYSQTMVR